jgi:LacI family transcriptional regulator
MIVPSNAWTGAVPRRSIGGTMSRLTLERVAALAGVSRSTASRVINGQDGVRPEVRRRVLDVIELTGFVPHAAARTLAGQRSRILGLAIRQTTRQVFSDPYFAALVQGVSRACTQQDQTLSLFLFESAGDHDQLPARLLRTKLIDGLVITATYADDPLLWQLTDAGIPLVVVGEVSNPEIATVDADNHGGAALAAEHLLSLGRERIGTVTGPMRSGAAATRFVAFERTLAAAGRPLQPDLVVEADFTDDAAYHAVKRLIPARPDAIFAFSDRMALGVLRALGEAGLSVPEDVAVMGFDDLPPAQLAQPPLTTIRQEVEQAGMEAVALLLERVQDPAAPARRVELPTRLVVRGSTTPEGTQEGST